MGGVTSFLSEPTKNQTNLTDGRTLSITPDSFSHVATLTLSDGTQATPRLFFIETGHFVDRTISDSVVLPNGLVAMSVTTADYLALEITGSITIYDFRVLSTYASDGPWYWHGGSLGDTITAGFGNDTLDGHAGDDVWRADTETTCS